MDCAVRLYHKGNTLEDIKDEVLKLFDFIVSTTSIWKWCKRFASQTSGIIRGLGKRLHCDETKIKSHRKGVFYWFWAIKCPDTKAIVGWHLSESRDMQNTKMLFWEARKHFPIDYFPEAIRTDKMPAYRFAIMKVFNHEVKHENVISFKHGNNVIETFWRCKRRFPKFRTLESARIYIGHWVCKYNEKKLKVQIIFIIPLVNRTFVKPHK